MDDESEKIRQQVAIFIVRHNAGVHLEARVNHSTPQSRQYSSSNIILKMSS
jgi:hypothetical protein